MMIQGEMFHGFSEEGIKFLGDLRDNNNREWFQGNKQVFKEKLEKPAKAFLEEMSDRLSSLSGGLIDGKIFRIYRDVRFRKDKTPYNSHIRMSFMDADSKKKACGSTPAFCFSLEPEQVIVGLGNFEFSRDKLLAYQQAVANDVTGKELEKIIGKMKKKGLRIESPEYKRVPAGFDKDHPRESLLRRKGLTVWNDAPIPKELLGHKAVDYCVEHYRSMLPLYQWLYGLK